MAFPQRRCGFPVKWVQSSASRVGEPLGFGGLDPLYTVNFHCLDLDRYRYLSYQCGDQQPRENMKDSSPERVEPTAQEDTAKRIGESLQSPSLHRQQASLLQLVEFVRVCQMINY